MVNILAAILSDYRLECDCRLSVMSEQLESERVTAYHITQQGHFLLKRIEYYPSWHYFNHW